jgi:hypothetical protein
MMTPWQRVVAYVVCEFRPLGWLIRWGPEPAWRFAVRLACWAERRWVP